ncbi:MAG: VOC family protein [Myxococcota bacterium]
MMQLGRIIVFAKHMEPMTRFYRDVLGLAEIETPDSSPDFVCFGLGEAQLCLHAIPAPIAEEITISDPPEARDSTPIKFAFFVDDVAETARALESRGARMDPIHTFEGLVLANGLDPEGNVFQISNRR